MALPSGPQRRTEAQRKRHLDASVVPVERALLHRADELERSVQHKLTLEAASTSTWLAAEFRALAEELHYW